MVLHNAMTKIKGITNLPEGFEPPLLDSKSRVITTTLREENRNIHYLNGLRSKYIRWVA